MDVYSKTPDERALLFIEWHARLIPNPVRRLRYLRMAMRVAPRSAQPPEYTRRGVRAITLLLALLICPAPRGPDRRAPLRELPVRPPRPAGIVAETFPNVWLVDKTEEFETYSNGLRIEHLFAVRNRPRVFTAIPLTFGNSEAWESRSEPAGIVFHTTESHMIEFRAERTEELKATGLDLLDYVRQNRSYHFVIDRFGRVYRIVEESDSANHAGWSVWADEQWVYLNLNDSFLGVAFEAQHKRSQEPPAITPAQILAGRVLTEMLRAKYRIREANCVAHAQVSVNPRNFRIGYHTDWYTALPYRELGIRDNYDEPLPSLYLFGFVYDPPPHNTGEYGLWKGLQKAEEQIRHEAAAREMPVSRYRARLRQRYREIIAALERSDAWKERNQ